MLQDPKYLQKYGGQNNRFQPNSGTKVHPVLRLSSDPRRHSVMDPIAIA